MTSPARPPRPEQIDELTRGVDLPLPAMRAEHMVVIAEALAFAWSDLGRSRRDVLVGGTEAEVNALMATRLSRLLDEDPLWEQLVRCVTRGTETPRFDGARLENRPDLSIHLSARSPSFPLLVECKLLDAPAGKPVSLYAEKGVRRFVEGEYGWAVRESFMLAYVRDRSTIASCLLPHLARGPGGPAAAVPLGAAMRPGLDVARTAHARSFRYVGRPPPGDDPGEIALWHLWLQPGPSDEALAAEA